MATPHLQVRKGSRDLLLKFWDPSISRQRLELETSNFARRFITRGTHERNAKLRQKGSESGHVTYFWNFGTPSISWEWLDIETSNLARRFITIDTNERKTKLGQRGSERGHVTYFWNFVTPSISWELLKLETSNLAGRTRFFCKSVWRHNFAVSGFVYIKFRFQIAKSCRKTANIIVKNLAV